MHQQLQVPTRLPNGLTFYSSRDPMANWPLPNNLLIFGYQDDFVGLSNTFYAVGGVGTPTRAIATTGVFANGRVVLGTTATSGDSSILQTKSNGFLVVPPAPVWFKIKFQVDDATNSNVVAGFVKGTDPLTGTPSGLYISKPAAGTQVNAVVSNGTNSSTVSLGNITAGVDYDVVITYDGGRSGNATGGVGQVLFWLYPSVDGDVNSQIPPQGFAVPATYLPLVTDGLYATMAVGAGTSAARTMNVDYWQFGCGRN